MFACAAQIGDEDSAGDGGQGRLRIHLQEDSVRAHVPAGSEVGWVTAIEVFEGFDERYSVEHEGDDYVVLNEESREMAPHMAVTNVFVRQPSGEWLLTHHHSSPLHVFLHDLDSM